MTADHIIKQLRASGSTASLFGARSVLSECKAFQRRKPSIWRWVSINGFPSWRKLFGSARA